MSVADESLATARPLESSLGVLDEEIPTTDHDQGNIDVPEKPPYRFCRRSGKLIERPHYVILDAGWRSAAATRVTGGAECTLEESFVSERANLLDVYDLWLVAVAAAMVKNTRFDPLLSLTGRL